jgi:hypothetical protein
VPDGELPPPVDADGVDLPRALGFVELRADAVVDLVLPRVPGRGHVEPGGLRRRLPVVPVVVPVPAGRFAVRFEEHTEPAALVAVEVLHDEPRAPFGPRGEVLFGQHKTGRGQDFRDNAFLSQPPDEGIGGVRRRLVHDDRPPEPPQAGAVVRGVEQGDAVAEVGGEPVQRGLDKVQLLPVERLFGEGRGRPDEQHVAAAVLGSAVEVRPELVGEQPERGLFSHGGTLTRPGRLRSVSRPAR